MLSLVVLFESIDSITLILFVLTSLLKRLSIQYVYERNFLSFACLSKRVQN